METETARSSVSKGSSRKLVGISFMHRRSRCFRLLVSTCAAILLALAVSAPACASELYFVAVFGAQRMPNNPKYSHSFAVFVRAIGAGPDVERYALDFHTISWLPETRDIRVLALLPEAGHNFDLATTLETVR